MRSAPDPSIDATCVWVIDGGPVAPRRPNAPAPSHVVAVDSGAGHALGLGLEIDVVVGDLDSIDRAVLGELRSRGVAIEAHPADKDRSDLDLALQRVADLAPGQVHLVAGGGGRLDHLLMATLVIGRAEHLALPLTLHVGDDRVSAHRAGDQVVLTGPVGSTVSIAALGDSASVTTQGFKWELTAATDLPTGSTLGLSNVTTESPARIEVATGTVLVFEVVG